MTTRKKHGCSLSHVSPRPWQYAFKPPYPGPVGAVYTTYTVFPGGAFFGIILAADLQNTYSLTPDRAWPAIQVSTTFFIFLF